MKQFLLGVGVAMLFGVPAKANADAASDAYEEAIDTEICWKLHNQLFHAANAGAPYELLVATVNLYDRHYPPAARAVIAESMLLNIYVELGKAKYLNRKPELSENLQATCSREFIRMFWR